MQLPIRLALARLSVRSEQMNALIVMEIHTMTVSDVQKIISCSSRLIHRHHVETPALMVTMEMLIHEDENCATSSV